jgi:hypothetical protein
MECGTRIEERYQNGKLHNGTHGEPAKRKFDPEGRLREEQHFLNGNQCDGINGEPAERRWDKNGTLEYWRRAVEDGTYDPDIITEKEKEWKHTQCLGAFGDKLTPG